MGIAGSLGEVEVLLELVGELLLLEFLLVA